MGTVDIENLLKEAHAKLDRAEKSYLAFDKKLDRMIEQGRTSKLTPVYSFVLLALVFWVGTWF